MKIDNSVHAYTLTPTQKFFVLSWHNLVHAYSLDSHRVRAMNSANILRELVKLQKSKIAQEDDYNLVAAEAFEIINNDPGLDASEFSRCKANFNSVYDPKTRKPIKATERLLEYYCVELQTALSPLYVQVILTKLKEILLPANPAPIPDLRELIFKLTANLLSFLLDRGMSLESLYQHYRQVLVPRVSLSNQRKYHFDRKFTLLEKLLTQPPQKYQVILLVHGLTDAIAFPEAIGGINFWHGSALLPRRLYETSGGKRFRNLGTRSLCAEVSVETQDPRAAGITAFSRLNNVMDLVRFEYEREKITIEEEFVTIAPESADLNATRHKIFRLPKIVPNPPATLDASQLQGFAQSVNQLVANGNFSDEGRDRIQSAFRLYRTGLDTNSFDNKLVNWWTAIEYLVRDGEKGGIGKTVENNIVPILCLGYIAKHLVTFRNAIVDLNTDVRDTANGSVLRLKDFGIGALYLLFKRPDMTAELLRATEGEPFIHYRLEQFLDNIRLPSKIAELLDAHDQNLHWQVQRLWRTRCDIVHSAGQVVNAALLCANLEFYLKSTLTMLFRELRSVPTLSSPKEFFDRQKHTYQKMLTELKGEVDGLFTHTLYQAA
jgi:hypothetical protein